MTTPLERKIAKLNFKIIVGNQVDTETTSESSTSFDEQDEILLKKANKIESKLLIGCSKPKFHKKSIQIESRFKTTQMIENSENTA